MNKQIKYQFGGATQDSTKSKHPFQYYFEAQHIKILATDSQSSSSVTNEKGNELTVVIPSIIIDDVNNEITYSNKTLSYSNGNELDSQIINNEINTSSNGQIIIGHTTTRDSIILFTTDDLGFDCVWSVGNILEDNYTITLLYVRNLGFSINNPIQALFNFENENIQKVYWLNGISQIRSINITHNNIEDNDALIDVPSNTLNFVGEINFSQPTIQDVVEGGVHTSGMIQYAYNLFRLNSTQTKLSPLSEIIPLDKGINLGGGELNEVMGATPVVKINSIDTSYTAIKVYAIKYTSFNEIPSIHLIEERELNGSNNIVIYDDGSTISSLTLEELLFLGSNPTIPQHIESKDNRLFLANVKTKEFLLPDKLDCRAYSFNSSQVSIVNNNVIPNNSGIPIGEQLVIPINYNIPFKHDAINLNYDIFKYQQDGITLGGEGKFIKYEIVQKNSSELDTISSNYRFLKDREIHRIGIEFYNNLGQTSLPKWIGDFKAPIGNLEGNFNTLKVTLKPEFYVWLTSYTFEDTGEIPVGYKIVRAERTINDRTIICQGVLNGMMVNSIRDSEGSNLYTLAQKKTDCIKQVKRPNFLVRTFEEILPLKGNEHLKAMQFGSTGGTTNRLTEIQYDSSERKADTYQYTSMFQLYSPEILFSNVTLNNSIKFNIVGGLKNSYNAFWGQERRVSNKVIKKEGKTLGALTPHNSAGTNININGVATDLMNRGLISETNGSNPNLNSEFLQWYRKFDTFQSPNNLLEYFIYGTPELTERGQGRTIYNNNSKYEYSNSLEGFLSDGEDEFDDDGPTDRAIVSLNSFGSKTVTIVPDNGTNTDIDPFDRIKLEELHSYSGGLDTDTILISELIRPTNDVYLGNIYGGNSYEDKKRTTYLKIGEYNIINNSSVQIDNPGDTYVQEFKFLRINKTDTEVYSIGVNQITEMVSVQIETSIDLKNRHDVSLSDWESDFQPKNEDYHQYNSVYSQQPTLIKTEGVDFTFKRIKNFDTKIQATKLKIPNESIDSWTDLLENEVDYLDGKYGPINSIINYKDKMFAFQDEAISSININPRVQVQSNDGIGIELGTGGIIYDYNYITTKSGSINKWGIVSTKKGIYYYDALNKSIGRIPDMVNMSLTDVKGFHSFFNNNYDYSLLKEDNPILSKGVVFGYDNYNNDVYFSLLQDEKSFTWCFNELKDDFIDLKTYLPSRYINKGEKFIIPNNNNNTLWEQYLGDYNRFFGSTQPSYIILQLNPESDYDCIFNNIHYNSELYLNDIDVPNRTLTHIQAYNEYQDSGRIPLIVGRGSNIRRKFREWQADIPRDGRERIRNPWIFLKLELENKDNYKLILHDIIIKYNI